MSIYFFSGQDFSNVPLLVKLLCLVTKSAHEMKLAWPSM